MTKLFVEQPLASPRSAKKKISTCDQKNSCRTIAGVFICFIIPPFSYTKTSVQILWIGGCYSKGNILFGVIREMIEGEKTLYLDFATRMKL